MRLSLRLVAACCASMSVVPAVAPAQAEAPLLPVLVGDRVRVTLGPPAGTRIVGGLERFSGDTMAVRLGSGALVSVDVTNVVIVEVSEGAFNRPADIATATLIGAASGITVVMLLGGWTLLRSGEQGDRYLAGLLAAGGASLGGTIGTMIGVAAGVGVENERWVTRLTPVPSVVRATVDAAGTERAVEGLRVGMRVRVQFASTRSDVIGRVVRLGDSLRVQQDDGRQVSVAFPLVQRVQRSRGRPSFVERSLLPVAIGALAGALLLPRAVGGSSATCGDFARCTDASNAAVAGTVIGGATGLIIGETRREERWETLPFAPLPP